MKYTSFILILVLSLGLSSINFAAETQSTSLIPQQSTFYSLYNGMVNSFTNMASSWDDKKNALIATAAIAALLINYTSIIDWVNDLIVRPTEKGKKLSQQIKVLSEKEYQEEINKPKQPFAKYYYEKLLQKRLEQLQSEQQK
jgi:hypothetical protein